MDENRKQYYFNHKVEIKKSDSPSDSRRKDLLFIFYKHLSLFLFISLFILGLKYILGLDIKSIEGFGVKAQVQDLNDKMAEVQRTQTIILNQQILNNNPISNTTIINNLDKIIQSPDINVGKTKSLTIDKIHRDDSIEGYCLLGVYDVTQKEWKSAGLSINDIEEIKQGNKIEATNNILLRKSLFDLQNLYSIDETIKIDKGIVLTIEEPIKIYQYSNRLYYVSKLKIE